MRGINKTIAIVVALVLALAVGFGAATLVGSGSLFPALVGSTSEERNSQIVQAVTQQEQVVLLRLSVQGISSRTEKSTILGVQVPGSARAKFIQYEFDAKLGVDGENVTIRQTGDDEYVINVPRFVFIGHDNVRFTMAVDNRGILSWLTPDIDTTGMINEILNDDTRDEYLVANDAVLRDQVRNFYSGIVTGISPDARLTFEFDRG